MRVLLVGTSSSGINRAESALSAAGHDVVRCHAADEAPFPCTALVEGRGCPLDLGPVDVVVDVHARPSRIPSRYEDGVGCGLRRGVPLVVAGAPVHPYWKSAAVEIGQDDDVVTACEEAAAAAAERQAAANVAREAASVALAGAGVDPAGTVATVHRRGDQLHVLLELPPRPSRAQAEVVGAVVRDLRALHPAIDTIDVAIA